jgi:hypothetical protein
VVVLLLLLLLLLVLVLIAMVVVIMIDGCRTVEAEAEVHDLTRRPPVNLPLPLPFL